LALLALTACDSLLAVDLPHQITNEDLDATAAELQVHSAIALFECGYTAFGNFALGHEDALTSYAGVAAGSHVYGPSALTGECDAGDTSVAWFDQIVAARVMLSNAAGTGAYDRLQGDWAPGDVRERLSAIASIYVAASLAHLGEFMCDISLDGGDLVPHDDVLGMAEAWITDHALTHLASGGDFALPNGIASSAELMATALRARIRWARGDPASAATDAALVPQGFTAWITREAGRERRNKIYLANTAVGFSVMVGLNAWWNGPKRRPNPATGQLWPDTIPFTGYLFLGLLADGRAVDGRGRAVRWARETRGAGDQPVPLGNSAVPDARVTHFKLVGAGPQIREVPSRYASDTDDIPYMTWQELALIRAEWANEQGDQAGAVAHINSVRASPSPIPPATSMAPLLPISGAYFVELTNGAVDGGQTDREAVRAAILEERRREFFAEGGRYWSTKLRNLDLLWFPRGEGTGPTLANHALQGGVRLAMPDAEYTLNPFLHARGGLAARGTGCAPAEAPVVP
jgi:hypothetical protein